MRISDMTVFISLLRGINVGGNKKIRMAELTALYQSLGFTTVQTLLQSGNVIFSSTLTDPASITAQLEAAIIERFGFESKIILRSHDQLRAIIQHHPCSADQLAEPARILVTFLQREPDPQAVEALRQAHQGSEIIHHQGQELYLYYPDGMGRSKLDNSFIERKLKVISTGRNWNTVNKLLTSLSQARYNT
jgi:uncharacterized protein (DUF1697 family)